MKILENKKKLDNLLEKIRVQDLKIGLIPTMGSIHEGHISLIKKSQKFIGFCGFRLGNLICRLVLA